LSTSTSETEVDEIDGEHRLFRDELLDRLVGKWNVTGKIVGQSIQQSCDAEWVLNHQFLKVHFLDTTPRHSPEELKKNPIYEAIVFIGRDNMSERYVAHWLDTFGGRFSEILGYGFLEGEGNSVRFVFEGAEFPLHNTFTWNSQDQTWSILIKQKNRKGQWGTFAEELITRIL
jgi:hypothetical protein